MSIFGKIASAIFGTTAAHASEASPTAASAPRPSDIPIPMPGVTPVVASSAPAGTSPGAPMPAPSTQPKAAMAAVDVAEILDDMETDEDDLDWRKSIVDLMKLLKIDSSLKSRKSLATELGYSGDMNDSATMNVWLHKQVMTKLAENGGIVPAALKH